MRASISLAVAVLLVVAPACSDDGHGTSEWSAGTTDMPATTTCAGGMVCDNDSCFWPAP